MLTLHSLSHHLAPEMPPKASLRVKLPPKQKKNDTLHDPVEYVGHGGSHGGERVMR